MQQKNIGRDKEVGKANGMDRDRQQALFVGIFFVISTLAGMLSVIALEGVMEADDPLTYAAENGDEVVMGILLDLVCAGAFVGVAVTFYPLLRRDGENLSTGYVLARIFEAGPFVIGAVGFLSLVDLGEAFVMAGSPADSHYQTMADLVMAERDWTFLLGPVVIFSLTALILNFSMFRSRLVPRFLSVWGMVGASIFLVAGVVAMFGPDVVMDIAPVIAVNEMALAAWLILKGVNVPGTGAGSAQAVE